jgi:hypothetical protein
VQLLRREVRLGQVGRGEFTVYVIPQVCLSYDGRDAEVQHTNQHTTYRSRGSDRSLQSFPAA